METATYLGDRVSAGGGCETAVTARTRCVWVVVWQEIFLKAKMVVDKSYVRPAILY